MRGLLVCLLACAGCDLYTGGSGSGSGGPASFTLDTDGFYNDGTRLWSLDSGPRLTGTFTGKQGALGAYIGGTLVGTAAINFDFNEWFLQLPPGTIVPTNTTIVFELTAPSQTPSQIAQTFALDVGRPVISYSGRVADERMDTVSFPTGGDAVHAHASATIDLSTGCPDVYMYPYLMDTDAPLYGRELTRNPLEWTISASAPLGVWVSEYQVYNDPGSQVVAWRTMARDASGAYHVQLTRGNEPLVTLDHDQTIYVDFKFDDPLGVETIATACVNFHPLAAPLEIVQSYATDQLFGWTLAAGSPLSQLIGAGLGPAVVDTRFIQHAAETVNVQLQLVPPAVQYSKTVGVSFPVVATSSNFSCGDSNVGYSPDPRCNQTTNVTPTSTTTSGALATPTWSVEVIDETSGYQLWCFTQGATLSCTIPPRASGEAAHPYRVVAYLANAAELAPVALTVEPVAEHVYAGVTYTGRAPFRVSKCNVPSQTVVNGVTYYYCSYTDYDEIVGLTAAALQFGAFGVVYSTRVAGAWSAVPYAPMPTSAATAWNGGTVGLP